jgi:hypothetical protein
VVFRHLTHVVGRHVDLAVGNLLGSNCFNMLILVMLDLADGSAALLVGVDPAVVVAALVATLLMGDRSTESAGKACGSSRTRSHADAGHLCCGTVSHVPVNALTVWIQAIYLRGVGPLTIFREVDERWQLWRSASALIRVCCGSTG